MYSCNFFKALFSKSLFGKMELYTNVKGNLFHIDNDSFRELFKFAKYRPSTF